MNIDNNDFGLFISFKKLISVSKKRIRTAPFIPISFIKIENSAKY